MSKLEKIWKSIYVVLISVFATTGAYFCSTSENGSIVGKVVTVCLMIAVIACSVVLNYIYLTQSYIRGQTDELKEEQKKTESLYGYFETLSDSLSQMGTSILEGTNVTTTTTMETQDADLTETPSRLVRVTKIPPMGVGKHRFVPKFRSQPKHGNFEKFSGSEKV